MSHIWIIKVEHGSFRPVMWYLWVEFVGLEMNLGVHNDDFTLGLSIDSDDWLVIGSLVVSFNQTILRLKSISVCKWVDRVNDGTFNLRQEFSTTPTHTIWMKIKISSFSFKMWEFARLSVTSPLEEHFWTVRLLFRLENNECVAHNLGSYLLPIYGLTWTQLNRKMAI